jgi:hypothetical protein
MMNHTRSSPLCDEVKVDNDDVKDEQSTHYLAGDTVVVESRTWPGINQPGGVGRITGVSSTHATKECAIRVSVRYILDGRHEKEIDIKWVKPYDVDMNLPVSSKNSLRDRSMLLGRCDRCGSLRKDCGSCDFAFAQVNKLSLINSAQSRSRSRQQADEFHQVDSANASSYIDSIEFGTNHDELNNYVEDSSSCDSEEIQMNKDFRRLKCMKAKFNRILKKHGSNQLKRKENSGQQKLLASEERFKVTNNVEEERFVSEAINSGDSSSEIGDDDILEQMKADFSQSHFSALHYYHSPSSIAFETSECSNPGTPDFSESENSQSSVKVMDCINAIGKTNAAETQVLDNIFIQPEGSAKGLPLDIVDRTKTLPYDELGSFFDEMVEKLETAYIPNAKSKLYLCEQKLRNLIGGTNAKKLGEMGNEW